jgi:hypothetical protein
VPNNSEKESVDVEPLSFIEIRTRETSELKTVVELSSPCIKRKGRARSQYVVARAELLAQGVEVVEIDLLRGGLSVPLEQVAQEAERDADYLITSSSPRGDVGAWTVRLREPLPVCPITVRPSDWATLDLKSTLDRVYDEAAYEVYIYRGEPDPPLSDEDRLWARQFVGPFGRGVGPLEG